MIATVLGRDAKLLVLVNGAYGRRMVEMCRVMGRSVDTLDSPEDQQVDPDALEQRLAVDDTITHVAVVHCETTSGILNPLSGVAEVCARYGRPLLVDAMSSFGAIDLDLRTLRVAAVAASSNKCLQGVPGVGFALIERETLAAARGHAHSLSLDLHAQWRGFEANQQWRFTPPTHVIAALSQALDEHAEEGGVAGRGARYWRNHEVLVDGMASLGFRCLLERSVQAPVIVTFLMPADPRFVFDEFYRLLADQGFLIYPGKLTVADSFRIGCIGDLDEEVMRRALGAVRSAMDSLGVTSGAPAGPTA
jgi:2-aminoethylphosphonate-pyruvate transaminase